MATGGTPGIIVPVMQDEQGRFLVFRGDNDLYVALNTRVQPYAEASDDVIVDQAYDAVRQIMADLVVTAALELDYSFESVDLGVTVTRVQLGLGNATLDMLRDFEQDVPPGVLFVTKEQLRAGGVGPHVFDESALMLVEDPV